MVPVFVLDDTILSSGFNRANRAAMLAVALEDLDGSLRKLGAGLVIRRGNWVREVVRLATDHSADVVVMHSDVSGYAQSRTKALAEALSCPLEVIDGGTTAVPPGKVLPAGGSRFQVFTPYHRAWMQALPWRQIAETPKRLRLPDGIDRASAGRSNRSRGWPRRPSFAAIRWPGRSRSRAGCRSS